MSAVPFQSASDLTVSSGSKTQEFFQNATRWLVVLIGFSIPVSTSFSEIVTSLFILCWLLSGDLQSRCRSIMGNPIARLSLAMFGLLLLATTWSTVTWAQAGRCLLKYREFVYLPLLLPVFRDERLKSLGTWGFSIGAMGMLLLSYFEWLTGFDFGIASAPNDYVIAKDRIIHSLLMSLLVYFSALELVRSRSGWRWLHAGTIALAVPNILFWVQGRTGYVLLGLLTVVYLSQQFGRRGTVFACLLVAVTGWGAYTASPAVRSRVGQTISQLKNQFGYPRQRSLDRRLEYYEHTLTLIRRHPFLGTGTGSFSKEYTEVSARAGDMPTSDPHNEYLHLAVQAGLPTAALFVVLLGAQWYLAGRLPQWEGRLARGIVVVIAAGSLFNSLILSITGGLIWSYFTAIAFASWKPIASKANLQPNHEPAMPSAGVTTRAA